MNMEELTSTFSLSKLCLEEMDFDQEVERRNNRKQLYWVNGECHEPFHPCDNGMSLGWNKPQNLFCYIHNLDVPSLEH